MSAPETPTWISVNYELPDSDITVLIAGDFDFGPVWMGFHDGEVWRSVENERLPVSHWQELPAPPEDPQADHPRLF